MGPREHSLIKEGVLAATGPPMRQPHRGPREGREGTVDYTPDKCLVLSPIFSGVGTPTLSIMARSRFVIGVFSWIREVTPTLELAGGPARKQARQVTVIM